LTTIKEIPLPVISLEQKVKFAILCGLEVCSEPSFVGWANAWLDGSDRSKKAAELYVRDTTAHMTKKAAMWAAELWDKKKGEWSVMRTGARIDAVNWSVGMGALSARKAQNEIDLIKIAVKAME